MKITTRGRYAVTAILDVALHGQAEPVPLADIAKRQSIPRSYLEQLLGILRKQGLLASTRGPAGGYRLARNAETISLVDVLEAVAEPVEMTRCGGRENCQDNQPCLTHNLWADVNAHMRDYLEHKTLADVLRRPAVRSVAERQDLRFGTLRDLAASAEQEAA